MAPRRPGRLIGAVLILILLVMAGLLYSPWHRHNSAARQACVFSPLEGSPSLEAGPHIQIEPVGAVTWIPSIEARVSPQQHHSKHSCQRAPPA